MPATTFVGFDHAVFDTPNPAPYAEGARRGVDEAVVRHISTSKGEPDWMLRHRLQCLQVYRQQPMPSWGPSLHGLDMANIIYYARHGAVVTDDWGEVPGEIRRVYERLGIPEAERKILAGVGAQYESDIIYHRLKNRWKELGVIFLNMDDALREHEELVRAYFMQCVPPTMHKFAALHGAAWSGGTFLYVPAGVKVEEPLQAYFRMNAKNMGQFEHTLIVVEEGAQVQYIEGCSAPKHGSFSLHAGSVEIFVKPGATCRYSSVENWSRDTYNLNTKRAIVETGATMEWIGGNMGAGVTMLYPTSVLAGEGARCDHLGLAFANSGQWQDTGGTALHRASHTSSNIISKSVSTRGGTTVFRGSIDIPSGVRDCTAHMACDALLLDAHSRTETIPHLNVASNDVTVAHEATVGRLNAEDVFYLTSRGLSEDEAKAMIVHGFVEPIVRSLPLEYAVEMNRLIELEMEGSLG